VIALIGTAAGLAFVGHDNTAAPGAVTVEGVDVSGMTADEVRAAVRERAAEMMREPVVISRQDDSGFEFSVTPAQLGAQPHISAATRAALEERSAAGRVLDRVGLAPTRDVPIRFTLDPEAVDRVVKRANSGFENPPVGATLRLTDDDIVVVPGKAGIGIDEAELRTELAGLPERIDLSVGEQPAPIGAEAAEAARQRALNIISAPVDVTFQGRAVTIQPGVLREALRFESRPPEIAVLVDEETIYADIGPAFEAREVPARDAAFRVNGDTVRLIPSAEGRSLNMGAMARGIAQPGETRAVRARFEITKPEVLTEELSGLGIKEQVGSFSTPYNCCEPRVENIERAAETLDGMIIPPGRRFSLNDALGPRTLDRGYVEAPQISGGLLEDGVGGGVSQVATTLFNAAFFAGLKIEAHQPHSFYISRYPAGREATISMGGPDLIFVNDWDASLLISAVAGSNDITIRLFSTSFGRRVETSTGEPYDYTEPEEIEVVDSSLEPGEREVEQYTGSSGFTVEYTRVVWEGKRKRSDENYRWTYQAQDAYIKVGPDVAPETEDTAPTEGGSDGAPEEEQFSDPAPEPVAEPEPEPVPAAPDGGAAPPPLP
jgi:vancomycin resistance protein YoaR